MAWAALVLGACASGGGLPEPAVSHNEEGARLLARGDLEDAEARFRLALEYHPRFSEPRANLGAVALQRGDLDAAESHLRGAIQLNEDFAEAWSNLGVVLDRQGRSGEARDAWERALSIEPGLVNARRNLAGRLMRDQVWAPARAHLLRLVQIAPDDPVAQGMLAYCELRLGRPTAARHRADAVLAVAPDEPIARVVRGAALAASGALAEARVDLELAQTDLVVGRDAQTRLAAVLLLSGERIEAERMVSELLAADPLDPAAHLVGAAAALDRDDAHAARRHADAALEAAPSLEAAQALRAEACARGAC